VWAREIFQCFYHRSSTVLYGTRKKRLKLLSEDADFYIINHDGVKVIADALQARPDIDILILDELALYRNAKTNLWKVTNQLAKTRTFVWGMSGAPTPRAPTDAYAQVRLLTPERVPKYFNSFRSDTMTQISQFRWVPKRNANAIVHQAMQPSVRYSRADCVDLPPTTYTTLEVPLTKAQELAYNDMVQRMQTVVQDPLFSGTIMAANAGVQLSKLIQIAAGFMYGFDGMRKRIEVVYDSTPRVNELKSIISNAVGKVIVFAPFVATVDFLYEALSSDPVMHTAYGAGFVQKIHGGTSKSIRDQAFISFQHSRSPRVLVAHPGTMAHGLTLTAADTIAWYSPVFSLETYEQANARITRPGQTRNTQIIHIQGSKVEQRVYDTLKARGNMQNELLRLFREGTA
jgi:SNF2 family DNA or RNA helicase